MDGKESSFPLKEFDFVGNIYFLAIAQTMWNPNSPSR